MTRNKVFERTVRAGFLISMFLVGSFLFCRPGFSQVQDVVDTKETSEVFLHPGDLVSLKVYSLTRIALSKIGIVDIANADVNEVLLIGQTVGETPIFIWDETGKKMIIARVIDEDMDLIIARIQRLLKSANIKDVVLEKNFHEGKVVLRGTLNEDDLKELKTVVYEFRGNTINLVKLRRDLIQIDAQISELNTTLTKELGIEWSSSLTYPEDLPGFDGSLGDLFKIGDFQRSTAIEAVVNALIQQGKGRILSKPSIVVSNGEEAKFLVGGEVPIITTTRGSEGGGTVQENVTFASYGVDLKASPEIINDKIIMKLSVEIRDLDPANRVGDKPAFTTRNAETVLSLVDGQTIVLAGLIKHTKGETVKRVPFLGSIPVVGMLFRNKSSAPNQDTEVVISLTPHILQQSSAEIKGAQVPSIAKEPASADVSPESLSTQTPDQAEEIGEDEAVDDGSEMAEQDSAEDLAPVSPVESAVSDHQDPLVTADENSSGAIKSYVQTMQQKISRSISFPYEAKEKGLEGTVVLTLVVLRDGILQDISVKQSSGQSVFDKDAINTAQILSPFDPFPAEITTEELVVTIPIVYSQESVLKE